MMSGKRLRNGQCATVGGSGRGSSVIDGFNRFLSSHSPVFRDFLRTFEQSGQNRVLQLHAYKRWEDSVYANLRLLRTYDDKTVVQRVKASHFYADSDTIKKLSIVLGERLCPAGKTTKACTSVAQMVEHELPTDVLMAVLCTTTPQQRRKREVLGQAADGNQLTRFLRHSPSEYMSRIAVLSHSPGLAAICPSYGCSTNPDLPQITIHVDIKHANESGASMWPLQRAPVSIENAKDGLFSSQPGKEIPFACNLRVASSTIKNLAIDLASNQCLVLGAGAWHLKDVCFKGGSLVFMSSTVTCEDCKFEGCTMVALDGATVALARVQFRDMQSSPSGLSLFVSGHASHVTFMEGSVEGGVQGVVVKNGAHFTASDLHIRGVEVVGVEASGEDSFVQLTGGSFRTLLASVQMAHGVHANNITTGVHVHSKARCNLSMVTICTMYVGVHIRTRANATLDDCDILWPWSDGVHCSDEGGVRLTNCKCEGSRSGNGCHVVGKGSRARATDCEFIANHDVGLCTTLGEVNARGCKSRDNWVGYRTAGYGGFSCLLHCISNGDQWGYMYTDDGRIRLKECQFNGDSLTARNDGGVLRYV